MAHVDKMRGPGARTALLPPRGSPVRPAMSPGTANRLATVVPGPVLEVGAAVVLTGKIFRGIVAPPLEYGAELVAEFRFAAKRASAAILITAFALAFGPAGVQGAGFLELVGALDRLGGLYAIFIVREFAPLVVAIVTAGVIGTSVTADLGARKVREELDALSVLGVDVVRTVVVPRFLVIVLLALFFNIFAIIAGTAGAALVEIQNHAPLGPFFAGFWAAANPIEFAGAYVKCFLFGLVIASVCCYKGMSVSGGSEAVGRAVNHAVVISFLLIGAIDYLFGQVLLASNPLLSEVR